MPEPRPGSSPDPTSGPGISTPRTDSTDDHEHPRGTLFLMILFLIMIIGFWTYVYVLLLERS